MMWNGMIARRLARRSDHRCQAASSIEQVEPRWVPSALCDLSPVLIQGPSTAEPGSKISVQTTVDNLGSGASPRFRVEYRLSLDEALDQEDVLLAVVHQKKIDGNGQADWTQSVKLPRNLPAGHYQLLASVDPGNSIAETNEANNALSSGTIFVANTQLSGRVRYRKESHRVEIHVLGDGSAAIDPAVTTWLVIHGRNQSSESPDLVQLATQIDQYQPGDQVLLLDWRKAAESGSIGGQGENYIRPVAAWAAEALADYGITGQQLNLVGYSWGADIADEMAAGFGQVNSILAIDSARDFPGGSYNPESPGEVDFDAHAAHSWAFFATSNFPFGSAMNASSAASSFIVTGADHFKIVTLVTNLLALPAENGVAANFQLSELLTGAPAVVWVTNAYSDQGVLDVADGIFDAVLVATTDGLSIEALRFFDGDVEQTILA